MDDTERMHRTLESKTSKTEENATNSGGRTQTIMEGKDTGKLKPATPKLMSNSKEVKGIKGDRALKPEKNIDGFRRIMDGSDEVNEMRAASYKCMK